MGVSYDNVQEATTTDATNNLQSVNPALQKLLNKRKNKLPIISPAIANIHNKTERVETNKIANEKEFITKRRKYIPKGSLYHIHYTNDLQSYYMTGGEHNERTKLIFRNDVSDSDTDYYNILNKQTSLFLKSNATLPTEDDYNSNKMTRNFAKKGNDNSSPAFEVSADDVNTSPLYKYISLEWYIKGDRDKVSDINKANVLIASQTIPNIGKLLPDFQYYRTDEVLNPKQSVMSRLNIPQKQNTTEQSTTQQTQTTPPPSPTTAGGVNAASGAGAASGPPAGSGY